MQLLHGNHGERLRVCNLQLATFGEFQQGAERPLDDLFDERRTPIRGDGMKSRAGLLADLREHLRESGTT